MKSLRQAPGPKESEGLYLGDLSAGDVLVVRTSNTRYRIVYLGYGAAKISGHPRICPRPRPVNILGSTSDGTSLRSGFIGVGLRLQFQRPGSGRVTTTSRIRSVVRFGRAL
jgi:hypothetical protein